MPVSARNRPKVYLPADVSKYFLGRSPQKKVKEEEKSLCSLGKVPDFISVSK